MREVPTDSSLKSYSEIISQFLFDPCDISNNISLRQLEEYLELTVNCTVVPDQQSNISVN